MKGRHAMNSRPVKKRVQGAEPRGSKKILTSAKKMLTRSRLFGILSLALR
jgi:hypothetical protein